MNFKEKFLLDSLKNTDIELNLEDGSSSITSINIDLLEPFFHCDRNKFIQPFKAYYEESEKQMIDSIAQFGVINPITHFEENNEFARH